MTDTKPELSVTEALAAADGPDLNLRPLPGSRMLSLADIEKLADGGDRQALVDAIYGRGRILHGASLWPVQPVRVRRLWWRWTVVAHPGGKVVAEGHAPFERWAWHAAGRAAAQIYNARAQEAKEAKP